MNSVGKDLAIQVLIDEGYTTPCVEAADCKQLRVSHPAPPQPGQVSAAAAEQKLQIWEGKGMNSLPRSDLVVKGGWSSQSTPCFSGRIMGL